MKKILHIFLYLNIYTAIANIAFGQNLTLNIEAEKEISKTINSKISPKTSHSNYSDLEKESRRILNVFQKNGFIDSRLISITNKKPKDTNEKNINYTATYFLGQKFSTIEIFFDKENFSKKEISNFTNETNNKSFTIPITEVENILEKINKIKTEKGNAFSQTYLTDFKKSKNKLSAQLITKESKTRTIDSIIIKGYEKFPRSYIKYASGIKKGTLFNRTKIDKANNAIEALPFASNIKSPEILFKDKKTSLYLYLEKQKSNNFDGIIGFSTNETTNKIDFNGYLDLQLINNLNYGESFILKYKADGDEQKTFSVLTTLPYLFKSPAGLNLGLTIFKQAENFSTTSQLAGVQYQINANSTLLLNYLSTNSTVLTEEENTPLDIEDFQKNELSLGSKWKYFQTDELFPIKSSLDIAIGYGSKKTNLVNEKQLRLELNASYILNLNNQNSIYLANKSGLLSSDTYLSNELYRIGGINNIRGFNENAIEASLYTLLITEYRYKLNNSLYLNSIIDLGHLENKTTKNTNSLYSFGLGTGFFTKTGLLKFSLANGKINDQKFNLNDLKIHLSLISIF